MTENIAELEKKLAKAREEENKKAGFTLVVFDDDLEELKEIKVKAHELSAKDQADIISKSKELLNDMDEIQEIQEKIKGNGATNQDWFKFLLLVDEPLKIILSTIFKLDQKIIATLPNIDLLYSIIQGEEFIKMQNKTSNLVKEFNYMNNNGKL